MLSLKGYFRYSPTESSDDPTFFFDAIAATEVFGVVSLLYDTLQMSPNHRPGDCHDNLDVILDKLQRGNGLADIVLNALKLINHAALVNLSKIQVIIKVIASDLLSVFELDCSCSIFRKLLATTPPLFKFVTFWVSSFLSVHQMKMTPNQ